MQPRSSIQKRLSYFYHQVTDYVLSHLEQGEVIWQKGWNSLGLPKNIVTNHHYRGWNTFFLNFITLYRHYKTPYFLTYNQCSQQGGYIRKGEKGYAVIYW